jgi:hypothetical protein
MMRRYTMTDDQVEKLIWDELQRRNVIYQDMIGLPNHGVDPNPEGKTTDGHRRSRANRFNETFGSGRMKELLCEGEYNPYEDYPPLKVSLKDLFRFWWNRCVDKGLVIDEILNEIYDYFSEKMRPPQKEKEGMNLTVDFARLSISITDIDQAA